MTTRPRRAPDSARPAPALVEVDRRGQFPPIAIPGREVWSIEEVYALTAQYVQSLDPSPTTRARARNQATHAVLVYLRDRDLREADFDRRLA